MGNVIEGMKERAKKSQDVKVSQKQLEQNQNEEEPESTEEEDLLKQYEKRKNIVDTYLNGKDCMSCKVIATTNPLLLAGFTIYSYNKFRKQSMRPGTQLASNLMFGSLTLIFLSMSFMSATGLWTVKHPEESMTDYLQRDTGTTVNKIRSLYSSNSKAKES